MSIAIKEFWKSRGCLIGSPTLNNILYPSVAEFLTHMKGLRPKNRIMGAFGSYGWAGGAKKLVEEQMHLAGIEIIESGIDVTFKPTDDEWKAAYKFGVKVAKKVKE